VSVPALLAAALLAGLLAGFGGGWKLQAWRWAAADGVRAEARAEAERLQARAADAAAERHGVELARLAAERRVITREVERVITVESSAAAAVCLGPDGLRIVAAAAGAASAAGQPAPAVPAPDATP
jgi:hypothetical protein